MDKKLNEYSGEELAGILNISYQELMRIQANVMAINTELEKRKVKEVKE
jgi:hypothetical protein